MFDRVYADLRLGVIDAGRLKSFASRKADGVIEKMEKLTASTAGLYSALETLGELESSSSIQNTNYDLFMSKIAFQRKLVSRYKEASLWSQTTDRCVGMMARTARRIRVHSETAGPAERSGLEKFYSRQLKMDVYTAIPEDAWASSGPGRRKETRK
ncbi:hypothetical protein SAY87_012273 [Trapa incisa]|uniref:Uncharacterized protein n=1 Tax=Trapa incisa TaxID=236973 RepID=A0AAN7GH70_9MYRT|nr:hypothetical protein SAY87_012273 [Trapa incisa]